MLSDMNRPNCQISFIKDGNTLSISLFDLVMSSEYESNINNFTNVENKCWWNEGKNVTIYDGLVSEDLDS